jgi:hypothetical protein
LDVDFLATDFLAFLAGAFLAFLTGFLVLNELP